MYLNAINLGATSTNDPSHKSVGDGQLHRPGVTETTRINNRRAVDQSEQASRCTVQERIITGEFRKCFNHIKFEARWNLLPVLKIVTCTVQLHVDIRHCY